MIVLLLLSTSLVFCFDFCARRVFDRCELFLGDEFEGVFANAINNANTFDRNGVKFTLTIAQDLFAIWASDHSTVFSRIEYSADRTTVNITDLNAYPPNHLCKAVGTYELSYFRDHHCLIPTLFLVADGCNQRRSLFGNLGNSSAGFTLLKKPCRGPADGICSIQERTVWVTEKKHDERSWLVFGGNNAYIETFIQDNGNRTAYFGRFSENNKAPRGRVGDTSSKTDLTFDRSMLALTELASYPAGQECPIASGTGFYRVRGLDETSATLTDGTYEPLHGVASHRRWGHGSSSSSSSSSDRSSSSSDRSSSSSDRSSSSSSSSSDWERKRAEKSSNVAFSTESSGSDDTETGTEHDEVETISLSEKFEVSSDYRHRKYHRESSKLNCGVMRFHGGKFVEDHCEARRHRFESRGMVMIDSCRGGIPPECDCDGSDCSEKK